MIKPPDTADRPRYRISADRSSAKRRVRYVESTHPDDGQCTICQLDELLPGPPAESADGLPEATSPCAAQPD